MRKVLSEKLEAGRILLGYYGSDRSLGPNGAFTIQGPCGEQLRIIASDGKLPEGHLWEHVSVSIHRRIPNWEEMCFVKNLFWADDEAVVQFHPPKSEYVNNVPNCLHLWRKSDNSIPLPPSILVGDKNHGIIKNDREADEIRHRLCADGALSVSHSMGRDVCKCCGGTGKRWRYFSEVSRVYVGPCVSCHGTGIELGNRRIRSETKNS